MRRLFSMWIGIVLACGGSPPGETADARDEEQIYLQGVVVDAARGEVFARDEEGRLRALDLASGKLLWRGEEGGAPAPVARVGRLLACLSVEDGARHRLRLAFLDLERRGVEVARSETVELPRWVSVIEQRGRSFGLRPKVRGGRIEIEWYARSWYALGAQPKPEQLAAENREARGRVVVDPESGAAEAAPEPRAPGPKEMRSHHYWDGSAFVQTPLAAAGGSAVLGISPAGGGGEELSLYPLGGSGGAVPLAAGRGVQAQLTADGGHLAVHSLSAEGEGSLALYTLSPVARVLTLASDWPLHSGVAGAHFFRVLETKNPTSRRLVAARLADGEEAWSAAVE